MYLYEFFPCRLYSIYVLLLEYSFTNLTSSNMCAPLEEVVPWRDRMEKSETMVHRGMMAAGPAGLTRPTLIVEAASPVKLVAKTTMALTPAQTPLTGRMAVPVVKEAMAVA